jgi:two-component SAPR family response regulator
MSGIDLAYEIRKHDPNVAIMLITAHLTDDLKLNEKFNSVKFCNVREKPVKFAKLRETIHSVLQPNIKVG